MKTIDQKLLKRFLKEAGGFLEGDWMLIGGTVLPSLGIDHRSTTDIDLIGMTPAQQTQTLKLMELAERLGLPVETINQAGAYFLSKFKDVAKHRVVLHKGSSATIYRPDATLFILLKLKRISDSDLSDCLQMLKHARKTKEAVDIKRLEREAQLAIKQIEDAPRKTKNLEMLLETLHRG